MAERVGFEPTCRLPDNTLSRRARYDHFGTSPVRWNSLKRTHDYTVVRGASGSPAPRTGAIVSTIRGAELPGHNHRVEVVGSVREAESRELMQTFFKARRSATRLS